MKWLRSIFCQSEGRAHTLRFHSSQLRLPSNIDTLNSGFISPQLSPNTYLKGIYMENYIDK